MASGEKEHDWDREMAEVDRLLKKLPQADPYLGRGSGAQPTVQKPAGAHAPPVSPAGPAGRAWVGTWVRVLLGLLTGIGMTQWPYTHGCGLRLAVYLVGVSTVIAAGVWSGVSSWRRRLAVAHVLSQGLILWGLMLAAREVLPRIGYAKTPASWLCHAVPVPPR